MFNGTFTVNVMEKGRVALPKKIRSETGGKKLVLIKGIEADEKCISGFTQDLFQEATRPELARPYFSDKQGRQLRRRIFPEAENVELDSQGRFTIPENMSEFAQVKDSVLILGVGDHFEIWDKKIWEEYRAKVSES